MFYAGFDMLFSILFPILFLVVLGMILYTIIGNISTWNKNNHSPRLTVPATVVAKRTEVSHHHTDNTMAHTFTTYYVTFQVESGEWLFLFHVLIFPMMVYRIIPKTTRNRMGNRMLNSISNPA